MSMSVEDLLVRLLHPKMFLRVLWFPTLYFGKIKLNIFLTCFLRCILIYKSLFKRLKGKM